MGGRHAGQRTSGKGRRSVRKKATRASRADRYDLYQRSVQEAEVEVEFFERAHKKHGKGRPRILREDFCGTFAICCEWAKKRDRLAIGVDLDPEPLAWGRAHNLSRLKPAQRERVRLLQQDVRELSVPKADVLAAQNFSFWIFKTRRDLLAYFRSALGNIAPGGIMVLDMMGGRDCYIEGHVDVRKYRGFRYKWEQESFDPVSHDARFHIHFAFPDGSSLRKAFTYEWRFWTIPEVRELLAEAGFRESIVYWEGVDEDSGEGDGEFEPVETADSDPSWIAYLVARA